ncbi:hypothetical protein RBH89_17780 [Paracidovorax avenae]
MRNAAEWADAPAPPPGPRSPVAAGIGPPAPPSRPHADTAALRSAASVLPPRQPLPAGAETRLRGYALARAIDGRHVEERRDIDRLRQATATVEAVRALLPHGRGNVIDDVVRSGHQSSQRVEAGRYVKDMLVEQGMRMVPAYATGALVAGAGNCGESSALGIMLHAPLLDFPSREAGRGEFLYLVRSRWIGHQWAQLQDERGPAFHIVLDPWLRGPAVFAEDSQWAASSADSFPSLRYGRASGLRDRAAMEGVLANAGAALQARFRQGLVEAGPGMRYQAASVFPSMPVVGRGFERRVQLRLQAPADAARAGVRLAGPAAGADWRSLVNEMLAVGVLRQWAPGMPIRSRVHEAPALLDAAVRLRGHAPRAEPAARDPARGTARGTAGDSVRTRAAPASARR